jgi:hypothetical protein
LNAPAQRTPYGKPDLSGFWMPDNPTKYLLNLAAAGIKLSFEPIDKKQGFSLSRSACPLPNCLIAPVLTQVTDEFSSTSRPTRLSKICADEPAILVLIETSYSNQENQSTAGLESPLGRSQVRRVYLTSTARDSSTTSRKLGNLKELLQRAANPTTTWELPATPSMVTKPPCISTAIC